MKRKTKMNVLYKIALILMIVCIILLVLAIIVAYGIGQTRLSVIFSAGGVLMACVGIIFALVSKPKKDNNDTLLEKTDNNIDIKI